MKRVLCVLMALLLSVALVGCAKEASSFTPTISVQGETANVTFPLEKADAASLRTMRDKATWTTMGDGGAKIDVIVYLDGPDAGIEVSLGNGIMFNRAGNLQAPLPAEMADLIRTIIGESQVESMTALCETAVAMLPEDVVLFKASTDEVMSAVPGLADIDYTELCAYFPPVYGYGCEVIMVAVNEADAATVEQLFRDYIADMSDDTDYPENAEGWKNNATVSVKDNIVTLCCLPDGVDAPDVLLGKF